MKKQFNVVKIISIVVFTILCLLIANTTKAETLTVGSYVGQTYMKKVRKDGLSMYLRSQWILTSDGKFAYCLEPWETIDEGQVYVKGDVTSYQNLSPQTMQRIVLLAYYGYGYEGHEEEKWYTITQQVIWKTVDPEGDFFFTGWLNGERISLYEEEMAELNRLVDEHTVLPSFANNTYTASISKDFTLTDTNNVLSKFKLVTHPAGVRIEGNTFTINSTKEKNQEIKLVKSTNKYDSVPFVYSNATSQNVMLVGNFEDINTQFNIIFKSGQIDLTKKAKEENYNEKITLEGAEYEVYDETHQLMGTITTSSTGEGSLSNLPFGTYTIKEKTPSYGYALDPTEYTVEINENLLLANLDVYEELDKRKIEINKQFLDAYTEEFKAEEGIYFDIYTEDGVTLVASILTDKDGNASIELPYGTYLVKQRNTHQNYYKVADFTITIDENTDVIKKELVNYPKIRIVPKKEIVEVEVPVIVEKEKEVVKVIEVPNTGKNEDEITFISYLLFTVKIAFVRKCKMI